MASSYHHGNLRQALLERAIAVLNDRGVENLSLRGLARDLGVSHAAPLRHFRTKSELLGELAAEGVRCLIRGTAEATTGGTALERLRQMALAYVEWARQNPAFHHSIRNPEVMRHAPEAVIRDLRGFAARQREEIEAAQAEGWRPGEPADVLFLHLVSLTAGTAISMTDPVYQALLPDAAQANMAEASLMVFLGSHGPE